MKRFLSILLAILLLCTFSITALAHTFDNDVFVTAEMIERDKEKIATYAAEGALIRNSVGRSNSIMRAAPTTKKLSVPLLLQDDARWANTYFPCGHTTFAASGCAMTSYAMISRYFGNSSETPVTFANKYYGTSKLDPCNQNASKAASLLGKTATAGSLSSKEVMENAMIAAIDKNKPIIIRVNKWGSHYFVAYGYYITSERSVTIYIRDPEGDFAGTLLSDYYPTSEILSYAIIG